MYRSKYCFLSVIISFVYEFLNSKILGESFFVVIKSTNIYFFAYVNVHG